MALAVTPGLPVLGQSDQLPEGPHPSIAAGHRSSYYKDGEIHVNMLGEPEGKPLTSGNWDFKPSWSKTGDKLVFFRRYVNDPNVGNWKTAICIINVDGTGFHQITDAKNTNFNQTWTRDGKNTPIWNRKNSKGGGYHVMSGKIGGKPGEEVPLTGKDRHTWAYTCLTDGRILVNHAHPEQGRGYFLMTPKPKGKAVFEKIKCDLAKGGYLDRLSLSVDETKICFEYQKGFTRKVPGRTLYLADFDAKTRSITNAKPFSANAHALTILERQVLCQQGGQAGLVCLPALDARPVSHHVSGGRSALPV